MESLLISKAEPDDWDLFSLSKFASGRGIARCSAYVNRESSIVASIGGADDSKHNNFLVLDGRPGQVRSCHYSTCLPDVFLKLVATHIGLLVFSPSVIR